MFLLIHVTGEIVMSKPSQKNKKWPPHSYMVYYGSWDEEKILKALDFDLVILHPGKDFSNITPEIIKRIQCGKDNIKGSEDDIIVIAYISIGEDETVLRGPGPCDKLLPGPVYYGYEKSNGYEGIIKTYKNFPSRYLDEVSYVFDINGFIRLLPDGMPELKKGQDGIPDENGVWKSFYVYAGDEEWVGMIKDRMSILSESYYVDGFFLDTLDTASPWGNYGWMQKDMAATVKKLRESFPDKYLIANRGLFLFEKYADIITPSIDGLMFESFISEWDWCLQKGILHPFLRSNYDILKDYVLPEVIKPAGFHMFFLNYMNPQQNDFYNLLDNQYSILKHLDLKSYSSYISTPDLRKVFPSPDSYQKKDMRIPEVQDVVLNDKSHGKFEVIIKTVNKGKEEAIPGTNMFFDIRYSQSECEPPEVMLLPIMSMNYSTLTKSKKTSERTDYSFLSYGLDKGKNYFFYVKIIGNNITEKSYYKISTLKTRDGEYPELIKSVTGEGGEESALLKWEPSSDNVSAYRIYYGETSENLDKKVDSKTNSFKIGGLKNGMVYYFSVCAVSGKGTEGCRSFPIAVCPKNCVPPPSPSNTNIDYNNGYLRVTWDKPENSDRISGYYVYCNPSCGMRLPLIIDRSNQEAQFSELRKGEDYTVFVTSFDSGYLQSYPSEIKKLKVPE